MWSDDRMPQNMILWQILSCGLQPTDQAKYVQLLHLKWTVADKSIHKFGLSSQPVLPFMVQVSIGVDVNMLADVKMLTEAFDTKSWCMQLNSILALPLGRGWCQSNYLNCYQHDLRVFGRRSSGLFRLVLPGRVCCTWLYPRIAHIVN